MYCSIMRISRLDEENFMQILVDWALFNYAKELRQHTREYNAQVPIVEKELLEKQIITWFVLEWVNPRTRTTIISEFIEKFVPDPKLAAKVSQIKSVFYSIFVGTQRISDHVLVAVDQYDKKAYKIKFKNKLPQSCVDLVFGVSIHPWEEDGTHRTSGIVSFNRTQPYGYISPEMQDVINRRHQKDRRNENVTASYKLFTYLKRRPIEHVDLISEFLDMPEGRKGEKIKAISNTLSTNGTNILKSLSKKEVLCLQFVYKSEGHAAKFRALEDRFGNDDFELFASNRAQSTLGQLREKGMLIVGKKTLGGRRYKIAVIPAELIPAMDRLGTHIKNRH